jgi:hypothetical protein
MHRLKTAQSLATANGNIQIEDSLQHLRTCVIEKCIYLIFVHLKKMALTWPCRSVTQVKFRVHRNFNNTIIQL